MAQDNEQEQKQQEQEEQEELEQLAEQDRQSQIKVLRKKITKIKNRLIPTGWHLFFRPQENKDLKEAKKYNELKTDLKEVNDLHEAKSSATRGKITSYMGYIICGLLFVGLLALIIVGVFAFISSIFPGAFDKNPDPNAPLTSANGITGEKFYGVRMVYRDQEQAHTSLLKDYVSVVSDCVQIVENANSDLNILLEIPSEDYDYQNLETDVEFSLTNSLVKEMINTSYTYDNPELSAENLSLSDLTSGIKYFGFDADLNLLIAQDIIEFFTTTENVYTYTYTTGEELDASQINALIEQKINTQLAEEKYKTRAEKLFIKDYILESDKMLSEVPVEDYVCMIYMPKQNVQFTSFSYFVKGVDISNFSLSINGQTFNNKVYLEADNGTILYNFYADISASADKYSAIDESNLNLFTEEKSLLDILSLDNALRYLKTSEVDGKTVYTFNDAGLKVEFDSTQTFNFAENEIEYN